MKKKLINYLISLIIIATTFGQEVDQIKLANEYYQSKEYDKAVDIYKKLSKQKRNIPQIHSNYLDLMINNDNPDDAYKYINYVVKQYPGNSRYRVDQIYVARLLPNQKEYKRLKDALYDASRGNVNTLKKIADELSQRQLHNDALVFLSHARVESQDSKAYALDFAKNYSSLGNDPKMIAEYVNFASQQIRHIPYIKNILQELLSKESIKKILEEVLIIRSQQYPDDVLYNDFLMWLYIQKNDYYGAFVQAKAIDRNSQRSGNTVMQVAKVAYDNQAYGDAILFYDYIVTKSDQGSIREKAQFLSLLSKEKKLTEKIPIDKQALYQIAEAYQQFYEYTTERNPYRLQALKNKAGIMAYQLNELDTAINILEILKNLPGITKTLEAQVKMDLGNINLIVGNHWEASLLYSQIEKDNPYAAIGYEAKLKNARLHYFMSNFDLAKAHLDILKRSTTKEIANDALELSLFIETNTMGDSNELGLMEYASISLLMYQNRFDEAREKLEILTNTQLGHPIRDDSFWLLAKLDKRMGNYKEALSSINTLISNYSEGVLGDDALFMKAQILEEYLDNRSEAQQVYRQFLEDFPGSAYAVEARRRFRILRGDGLN
ncbi:tetratricopeptide repeat protein [Cyclobacteriaceae bacterium]|nr:tetratricopeptide repeat protein [Cyclobacteriaceae bacterium]